VDFVVVGLGLGALAMLLGIVLLAGVAPRRARLARNAPPAEARRNLALAAHRRGAGQALIYAGAAIFLATLRGLAGSLDARTGAFLVATTTTVAALGLLVWGYLDHLRNPVPPPTRARIATADSARPPETRPLIAAPEAASANGHGREVLHPAEAGVAKAPAHAAAVPLLAIAARSVTTAVADPPGPGLAAQTAEAAVTAPPPEEVERSPATADAAPAGERES
jgi:hypothetical protein